MTEQDIKRLEALRMATGLIREPDGQSIVALAEKFEAFLNGKKAKSASNRRSK